ncbi:MAG: methylenetetrahydrofolate--tRNA-(uracil(54)-C(5))-methyltransferase (FADH(2)-oxidizing) TrmFO [Deltaproteobacteria bacterium]|nr:methylenetetrahydrofolate--tRNA-(uracil(54)-C(5))-methyltransferase (FADH(2)-oxidizing) TrmFO [Candidatus Anaeroferrophillus wilburensis]MBN2889167.1 methylenetetrahydrofolate--tRNA-(uracil(54)-C(5))-methyltransferase (FADH(2)-oxidizing) TrmFO [Deltaproteobacteria bacterium]
MHLPVTIIGAGLAGCEAAWQLARHQIPVTLYDMKPEKFSPAHGNPDLAELVCSNSLRSDSPEQAAGLLKREMEECHSLIMKIARQTQVPAGSALAVDRQAFAHQVTEAITSQPMITLVRREISQLPAEALVIVATGPLTSEPLTASLAGLVGEQLHFYDATAPIVAADSLDYGKCFWGNRYQPEDKGDYLNCPLTEEEYLQLVQTIADGDQVQAHVFEDQKVFEGCMPIEAMVARGTNTLAFGPLKPVGLINPWTGRQPHAVVQLRPENREATMLNLVGFQTRLSFGWQEKVIHLIPGLEAATIYRYGTIHRNTFINAPQILNRCFQHQQEPRLFFAGQISGVEGYIESAASGLSVGLQAALLLKTGAFAPFPETTALGALASHISNTHSKNFQPMNINFGLFPPLGTKMKKAARKAAYSQRAMHDLRLWLQEYSL